MPTSLEKLEEPEELYQTSSTVCACVRTKEFGAPIFGSSLSEASDTDDMIDARVCARASSCVCQTSAFQGTPDIFSLLLPGHLEGHLLSEHHYGTEVGWDRSQTKPLQRCYAYYAYDVYFAYCAYIP